MTASCHNVIKKIPIKQCVYAKDPGGLIWQTEWQWRLTRYREYMKKKSNR